MCDRIDEERLATCGESAIDLAISNVRAGGLPFSALIAYSGERDRSFRGS